MRRSEQSWQPGAAAISSTSKSKMDENGLTANWNGKIPTEDDLWALSLNILRERALQAPTQAPEPAERRQLTRYRSAAIRTYVLKRAKDQCESCGSPASFTSETGRPYLEPYHIRRLSDGGPDHPDWVAALCPNCHRRAHYSNDKTAFNRELVQIIRDKEIRISINA